MWSDQFIGIPYLELGRSPQGVDCLGLFLMVFEHRQGIKLHDPFCTVQSALKLAVVNAQRERWSKVLKAREGDAVLFNVVGRPLHIGYCMGGAKMLHCEGPPGSVIEDFTSHKWLAKVEGIYRYEH